MEELTPDTVLEVDDYLYKEVINEHERIGYRVYRIIKVMKCFVKVVQDMKTWPGMEPLPIYQLRRVESTSSVSGKTYVRYSNDKANIKCYSYKKAATR